LVDLQRALDAQERTRQALDARRAGIRAVGRNAHLGAIEAAFKSNPMPGNFRTPEEAFTRTLFERTTREQRGQTDTKVARDALTAFHRGDAATAERLYKGLTDRSIARMNLNSEASNDAMRANLMGAGRELAGYMGSPIQNGAALAAQTPPQVLERARRMMRAGESPEGIQRFLQENTEFGRASLRRKAVREARAGGRMAFMDALGLDAEAGPLDVLAILQRDPERFRAAQAEFGSGGGTS
jgi:hypothetical protein